MSDADPPSSSPCADDDSGESSDDSEDLDLGYEAPPPPTVQAIPIPIPDIHVKNEANLLKETHTEQNKVLKDDVLDENPVEKTEEVDCGGVEPPVQGKNDLADPASNQEGGELKEDHNQDVEMNQKPEIEQSEQIEDKEGEKEKCYLKEQHVEMEEVGLELVKEVNSCGSKDGKERSTEGHGQNGEDITDVVVIENTLVEILDQTVGKKPSLENGNTENKEKDEGMEIDEGVLAAENRTVVTEVGMGEKMNGSVGKQGTVLDENVGNVEKVESPVVEVVTITEDPPEEVGKQEMPTASPAPSNVVDLVDQESEDMLDFGEEEMLCDEPVADTNTNNAEIASSVHSAQGKNDDDQNTQNEENREGGGQCDSPGVSMGSVKQSCFPNNNDDDERVENGGGKSVDAIVKDEGGVNSVRREQKRKREPIPFPPASVKKDPASVLKDSIRVYMTLGKSNREVEVVKDVSDGRLGNLIPDAQFNVKKKEEECRKRYAEIWPRNVRCINNSQLKVPGWGERINLGVEVTRADVNSTLYSKNDAFFPDPYFLDNKDYKEGFKRAKGFLDNAAQKTLMSYPSKIRNIALMDLGKEDLRPIQNVQNFFMDLLTDLKKSLRITPEEREEDRYYMWGCALFAEHADMRTREQLMKTPKAQRQEVLMSIGKSPFTAIEPNPANFIRKLMAGDPRLSIRENMNASNKPRKTAQLQHGVQNRQPSRDNSNSRQKLAQPVTTRDWPTKSENNGSVQKESGGVVLRRDSRIDGRKLDVDRKDSGSDKDRNRTRGDDRRRGRVGEESQHKTSQRHNDSDNRRSRQRERDDRTASSRRSPQPRSRRRSPSRDRRPPDSTRHSRYRSPSPTRRSRRRESPSFNERIGRRGNDKKGQMGLDMSMPFQMDFQSSLQGQSLLGTNPTHTGLTGQGQDLTSLNPQNLLLAQQPPPPTQMLGTFNAPGLQLAFGNASNMAGHSQIAGGGGVGMTLDTVNQQPVNLQGLIGGLGGLVNQMGMGTIAIEQIQNQQAGQAHLRGQGQILNVGIPLLGQPQQPFTNGARGPIVKLKTGGCRAPDPAREREPELLMRLNEDAFWICENAIAIADGLGRTLQYGVSSAGYAEALAKNSAMAMEELIQTRSQISAQSNRPISPKVAIEYAFSQLSVDGASTLTLLALDPFQSILHVAKIGDGGYVVLRQIMGQMQVVSNWVPFQDLNEHPLGIRSTHYLTSPKLRSQIGGFHPAHAVDSSVVVQPGDIIIAATDGFFDVIYLHGMKGMPLRNQILELVHRRGLDPKPLAEQLTILARDCAQKGSTDCPICEEARRTGNEKYAQGAQPDDIAVVVAYVQG